MLGIDINRKDTRFSLVLLPFIVFLHAKNNLHDLGRNQKAELKGGASMYNTIWAQYITYNTIWAQYTSNMSSILLSLADLPTIAFLQLTERSH